MDIKDQNELIFALQRIAFANENGPVKIEGNKKAERFKNIAKDALLMIGIEKPKTFCKICWNEIPNEEQNIIYFCDACEKECDHFEYK